MAYEFDDDTCQLVEPSGFLFPRRPQPTCSADRKDFDWMPRGLRVRTCMLRRGIRRMKTMKDIPVIILLLHLALMPATMIGLQLMHPTVVQRVERDVTVHDNEDTLQAIWALVENMHYGRDPYVHQLWDETLETVDGDVIRRSLDNDSNFASLAARLLGSLGDPYSSFASETDLVMPPPSANAYGLAIGHEKATAGIVFPSDAEATPPAVVVTGVMPDSPAEEAGLRIGDIILEVTNGGAPAAPANQLPLQELRTILSRATGDAPGTTPDAVDGAASAAANAAGTSPRLLTLRVQRRVRASSAAASSSSSPSKQGGATTSGSAVPVFRPPETLTLSARATSSDAWVRGVPMSGGSVGYLRIRQFTEVGTEDLVHELRRLREGGASGWVLDLRNNPGGQLTEAMLQGALRGEPMGGANGGAFLARHAIILP